VVHTIKRRCGSPEQVEYETLVPTTDPRAALIPASTATQEDLDNAITISRALCTRYGLEWSASASSSGMNRRATPTQIGRALRELGITWIAAHSPQAKGRVERNFGTAQDRLVKGMRVAGVKTIEQANQYLTNDYLAWWERELTVEAANPDDAHRPLDKSHHLAASLSHVETRQVRNDYTLRWNGKLYQIERQAITTGLRRANVRVEEPRIV
jgi:hypothetical protein